MMLGTRQFTKLHLKVPMKDPNVEFNPITIKSFFWIKNIPSNRYCHRDSSNNEMIQKRGKSNLNKIPSSCINRKDYRATFLQ